MDLRETGWSDMDWIHLTQDRDWVEGSCGLGNEPTGSVKCLEILEYSSDW
jgi:hypothetical protein